MIGTVNEDSGAMIRDGIKSVNQLGVCHDVIWPYNISVFTKRPSDAAYHDALLHQALVYARINQELNQLKAVLADGFCFVFGFAVYESFESEIVAKTGYVEMPKRGEAMLGGHAVLCVGYDDFESRFICRNSWGSDWGDNGYFTMPFQYLLNDNLSADHWVIKVMEETDDTHQGNREPTEKQLIQQSAV
jgi:C1A family cysteine protease